MSVFGVSGGKKTLFLGSTNLGILALRLLNLVYTRGKLEQSFYCFWNS